MTATIPALLPDPDDLSVLRATGADPDELFAAFAAWARPAEPRCTQRRRKR